MIVDTEEKVRPAANHKLISEHVYLIKKVAEYFSNLPDSRAALEEVGYIGLLNAANLYNDNVHKMSFEIYAQIMITKEIHQYVLGKHSKIKQPDWLFHLNYRIDQYVIHYHQKHQQFPRISQIAEYLNINNKGLHEVLKARNYLKEFCFDHDAKIDFERISPILQTIKNKTYQSFKLPIEDIIKLKDILNKVKVLQEKVVYYFFVMDLNQTRVARKLGLSPEKVKKIKKISSNQTYF